MLDKSASKLRICLQFLNIVSRTQEHNKRPPNIATKNDRLAEAVGRQEERKITTAKKTHWTGNRDSDPQTKKKKKKKKNAGLFPESGVR